MIMEWNYTHDADITIGEVHISRTSRILLICLVAVLIILGSISIYFRSYIYDYIANPSIVLTEKEITLEVHSKLDPELYIANNNKKYSYTINSSNIDTDKLGTYTITYKSKNKVHDTKIDLIVNIVDTTEPTIKLKQELVTITRGDETDTFNAKDYIESIKDNYSDTEKIVVDYTTDLDFSKDELKVIYSATDEAGNIATATINIAVYESKEALEQQIRNELNQNKPSNTNNSNNTQNTTTTTNTTEAPKPSTASQTPYINGIHTVNVAVGTDFSTLAANLQSGVVGSGTVYCDPGGVNVTVAGSYTVYWSSSDGVTTTSTVIVE